MRLVPLGVAVVAAALVLLGLGDAPFVDPPEGFHAEIARVMSDGGDWVTPRLDGVRYFDKPPLMYWLMASGFGVAGPSPASARLWSALAAVGCAVVTARLGTLLGGPRVGLLAGSMVAANLGVFLYGRIVKPDLIFVFWLTLAFAGFSLAYLGRGRWALALFYVSLGFATLAKDLLGAVGLLLAVGLFLRLTRERPLRHWVPWWGIALFVVVSLPWYALVELRNRGFLWYTIVDNHVLNFLQRRTFPDEDVPLTALEFLLVTVVGFLPWTPAAVWGAARVLRRPWETPSDRLWMLQALWAALVIGFFTLSPFKLPHYGLPAFPALALLAARAWDAVIAGERGAPRSRAVLLPTLLVFALIGGGLAVARVGGFPFPAGALSMADVTTRNVTARGGQPALAPLGPFLPILTASAAILTAAAAALAVATWRRAPASGFAVALAAMAAFLPLAGRGMTEFARSRSTEPMVLALVPRVTEGVVVVNEGAIENSASVLLTLRQPIHIVHGLQSNLAFGATFPDAGDVFWSTERLRQAWSGRERCFLISTVPPGRSVTRALDPGTVHLLAERGGRRLYSNLADP